MLSSRYLQQLVCGSLGPQQRELLVFFLSLHLFFLFFFFCTGRVQLRDLIYYYFLITSYCNDLLSWRFRPVLVIGRKGILRLFCCSALVLSPFWKRRWMVKPTEVSKVSAAVANLPFFRNGRSCGACLVFFFFLTTVKEAESWLPPPSLCC